MRQASVFRVRMGPVTLERASSLGRALSRVTGPMHYSHLENKGRAVILALLCKQTTFEQLFLTKKLKTHLFIKVKYLILGLTNFDHVTPIDQSQTRM